MNQQLYTPIIIIGAARSGTNMLRDVLVQLPGFSTWPCDEINYIWRHGNVRVPTDEFGPELATPSVKGFIRRAFERQARKQPGGFIVEKTCANSLRVGFVDRVIPEATYIYITRDGRDVVASAMKRWSAELDMPYILRKARFVPYSDVPYYGARYLWNRIYLLASRQKRLAFWGPKFKGMDDALEKFPLAGVCALQWLRSVERAEEDLAQIPSHRVIEISYEAFVSEPAIQLERIIQSLNADVLRTAMDAAVANVNTRSIGKWRCDLSSDDIQIVESLLEERVLRDDNTAERHI